MGFRAEPSQVSWVVVDGPSTAVNILGREILISPNTYSEAESLAWYRTEVANLIEQYKPQRITVRFAEPSAQRAHLGRARIEGVLMECGCAMGIEIIAGPIATIASRLNMKSKEAKAVLDGDEFRGIQWPKPKAMREAIMAAAAALGE